MLDLNKYSSASGGYHRISGNEKVLLRDDGYALITTGTNTRGRVIVSALVDVDEDSDIGVVQYLNAIITQRGLEQFLNRKNSLRNTLRDSDLLYIVEKNLKGQELRVFHTNFDEIPDEYRPLESSLCPEHVAVASFVYRAALNGGLSDHHLATPESFKGVVDLIVDFFRTSIAELLSSLNLRGEVLLQPAATGSFELGFVIDIKEVGNSTLFANKTKVDELLLSLYTFMLSELPGKGPQIDTTSKAFLELKAAFDEAHEEQHRAIPEDSEKVLIESIKLSLPLMSEIEFGKEFTSVSIVNRIDDSDVPVGTVDSEYLLDTKPLIDAIEEEFAPNIQKDEVEQTYHVQVFRFNRETGNGSAYVKVVTDGEEGVVKAKVQATGLEGYEHTSLSKSLDSGSFVKVLGFGKRVDGTLKAITIPLRPVKGR